MLLGDRLRMLLEGFRTWSVTAERTGDGWEVDYPDYFELVTAAEDCMIDSGVDAEQMAMIGEVWCITEEREDLRDFAQHNSEACWGVLEYLAKHGEPDARWQAYSAAREGGPRGAALLHEAIHDPHPYCRRRAILALADLRPDLTAELRQMLRSDVDEQNRYVAEIDW